MSNKQREVLRKIAENIDRALSILNEIPESCSHNGLVEDVADVLCLVKETYIPEALAEPLRNCEVGTEREQSQRFDKYCYDNKTYEYGCGKCPLFLKVCCELAWAQLPYESEVVK